MPSSVVGVPVIRATRPTTNFAWFRALCERVHRGGEGSFTVPVLCKILEGLTGRAASRAAAPAERQDLRNGRMVGERNEGWRHGTCGRPDAGAEDEADGEEGKAQYERRGTSPNDDGDDRGGAEALAR
jgi:hypothetical protein